MFNSYNDEDDYEDRDSGDADREISVGTTSIVAIFFVLALVCAAFFGIGYLLGRRQSPQSPIPSTSQTSAATTNSALKPVPGSPAANGVETGSSSTTAKPDIASLPPAPEVPLPTKPISISPHHANKPTPVQSAAPAIASSPNAIVVQIAAVSHHEDADVLVGALTRRGYSVAVRQVPQDKLFHVQIGPFANRKDADAMRQRLLTDGYNAIVK